MDHGPILVCIARSHLRDRGSNGARTRMGFVDHGNPSAWHGTSTTAPGTTVTCANDAEVRDGLEHWTNMSLYSGVWQMSVIFHPSYTIGG